MGPRPATFTPTGRLQYSITILQFCVAYEMASRVFRAMGVWSWDVRKSFAWLLVLSLAAASGLTWLASPPTRFLVQSIVIKTNFFTAAWMSELFVGMMTLSARVKRPWNTHVAAISKGFGVYSILGVIIESGQAFFGAGQGNTQAYSSLSHFRIAVYLGCVAYWIVALWRDVPPSEAHGKNARTTVYLAKRGGILSSEPAIAERVVNTDMVYFLVAVAIFFAILIAIARRNYYRGRRSPEESWGILMRRLISVDRASVAKIALDLIEEPGQSARDDSGFKFEPSEIFQLIGGLKGLEVLEKNSQVLIDMASYLQRSYPEALIIAEKLRQSAREIESHVGRLRGAAQNGNLKVSFPFYGQRVIATYYLMTRQLLNLFEQGNVPMLADLQKALT